MNTKEELNLAFALIESNTFIQKADKFIFPLFSGNTTGAPFIRVLPFLRFECIRFFQINRSAFITLFQAAMKSLAKFCLASWLA